MLDVSLDVRGDLWAVRLEQIAMELRVLLDDLMKSVDELGLPGLDVQTAHLGVFKLSETAETLCKPIRDLVFWDIAGTKWGMPPRVVGRNLDHS